MQKKLIAAVTAAVLLVSGLCAALAAPGTSADPFITLSYLTGTFYPEMEQAMLDQAQQATAETEQEALDRLSDLAGGYLVKAGGSEFSDTFTRLTLAGGDLLSLPTGASLLLEAGQYTLTVSGTLLDVTDGTVLPAGVALTPGHRYLVVENSTCALDALSDSVYLSVQGNYSLNSSGKPKTPFIDVGINDWHRSYVHFAYERGLFNGTGATIFSPNTNMNRAMLVTVLSRLAGVDSVVTESRFDDVASGIWYEIPVKWAASVGIVNGVNEANTLFAPDVNVTREQMAVMLYRYTQDYLGIPLTPTGDLTVFSDRGQIQSWAEPAMSWAVGVGIINGYTNGTLSPGGSITRAEVATMLQRFDKYLSQQ